MWTIEAAQRAMEKLIDETDRGIIKWRRWGSTDSSEKPAEPKLDAEGNPIWSGVITIPNWTVYYTKLVGTHVTVENHLGDKRFSIYWGPPTGRSGGGTMDMEKELPLMDELLVAIRNSNPESLPKWRFQWIDENKGPECWWMKQEHIWHTVKDTLDVYVQGEVPHFAGNPMDKETDEERISKQEKDREDQAYGRVPRVRERYAVNVWERLEPEYAITKYQVMHETYGGGMSEIATRPTLEECNKVIEQHYHYYHSPYDPDKVKEWENV